MAEAKRRTSQLKSVTDDKALVATAIGKAAAAEHRLYNLGRLVSAWIWETDAEFRLTDVSYRVFDMLGLNPQELIGRRLRDIGSFVTLEDFPADGESQSTFRDVFFEVPDREGQKRLFLVSSLVLVMIANAEGEIEYANEKFQEATGYNLEELKRISLWNLVDMKKDEREKKLVHVNEGNEWFGETHYRRKNGALFWAAEHITPIPAQDGGIGRLLWVIEDKTARRVYSTHLENRADPELFTDMPSRIRNAVFLVLSSDNSLMAKLQMENLALDDALNRLPLGVIVVDAFARPIRSNQAAQAILDADDGLSLGRDGLQGEVDGQLVKVRDIIWRAGRRRKDGKEDDTGAIALERPSGDRPLSLVITSLRTGSHYFDKDRPAALLFIGDPETHPEFDEDRLSKLYGLTRAEARLASLLAQDLSLADAADELSVSQHTVRTHVKRIFSKTTTERQSVLIRLLLSGPASISPD